LLVVPLALAGLGTGLTISPNITLTLTEVPVPRAGTASGILQTGQRLGTAAGIALVGAVLFGTLEGGDWTDAAVAGLRTAIALTAVALVVALHDQLTRPGRTPRPAEPARAADRPS
jgi:MFS family permease